MHIGDEGEAPDDCVAVLVVLVGAASDSGSSNLVLRSVVDEQEETALVGSSVLGEEILEELNGDEVGMKGVAGGRW